MTSLSRKSYWFFMFSRIYWLMDTFLTLIVLACNTTSAAILTSGSTNELARSEEALLALAIVGAIVVGFKGLMGFGESSQVCRGVSRDLDTLSNDLRKGRIDDAKVDKRIERLKRRLPAGSCVILRY